jgi:hypothetical protein
MAHIPTLRRTRSGSRRLAHAMLFAPVTLLGQAAGGAPVAAAAEAATAAAPRIAGVYGYVGGEGERSALISAIEGVIHDMIFIARPIARKRLRAANMPSDELMIAVTADRIVIVRPGRPTVSAPRDGSEIVWRSPDGDEFRVRHHLVGDDRVVQEFVGDGNRSENTFSLAADGARLTVQTSITADRLPRPLHFRTTYQRKPKAG